MKKLIILLLISIACFGQITRRSSGGSSFVGLKDTTVSNPNDGIKSAVGVTGFYFNDYKLSVFGDSSFAIENGSYGLHIRPSGALQSVTAQGTENVLTDTNLGLTGITDGLTSKTGFYKFWETNTLEPYLSFTFPSSGSSCPQISLSGYGTGTDYTSISLKRYSDAIDGGTLSKFLFFEYADTLGGSFKYSVKLDTYDSSLCITNESSGFGVSIKPNGNLTVVDNDGEYGVSTTKNTLSGTVYVKDTNNVIKYLTFTNGLLTASDYETFVAGVFENKSSNLTMTDFKKSPEYAEFLEFKKYLAMKQSFDNNNSTKGN
jgi:hypothetical protein